MTGKWVAPISPEARCRRTPENEIRDHEPTNPRIVAARVVGGKSRICGRRSGSITKNGKPPFRYQRPGWLDTGTPALRNGVSGHRATTLNSILRFLKIGSTSPVFGCQCWLHICPSGASISVGLPFCNSSDKERITRVVRTDSVLDDVRGAFHPFPAGS